MFPKSADVSLPPPLAGQGAAMRKAMCFARHDNIYLAGNTEALAYFNKIGVTLVKYFYGCFNIRKQNFLKRTI